MLGLKEILRGDLIFEPILPILVGDSTLRKRLSLVIESLPLPLFIHVWVLSRLHIGLKLLIKLRKVHFRLHELCLPIIDGIRVPILLV